MSKKVAQGIRGNSGIWKHGHTYQVRVYCHGGVGSSFRINRLIQAHPLACSAALAVQKTIEEEKLLQNVQEQGQYLGMFFYSSTSDLV